MTLKKLRKYLKSRTVWVALVAAALNIVAVFNIDKLAGMDVAELEASKGVIASQLTVLAAGACDLIAIFFRIRAKASFD